MPEEAEFILRVLSSVSIAVFGWIVAHRLTSLRDQANRRTEFRVEFLVDAYRRLEKSSHRTLEDGQRFYDDVETAIADIQLMGTPEQAELVVKMFKVGKRLWCQRK